MKKIFLFLSALFVGFPSFGQVSEATINTDITYIKTHTYDATHAGGTHQDIALSRIPSLASVASGTNTYAASVNPLILSYTTNFVVRVFFTNGNTGASTLNLNTIAAIAIKKMVSGTPTALSSGDIQAATSYWLLYDGTQFQIDLGGSGSGSVTGLTPTSVKTSNYTAVVNDLVKCDVTSGFTVTLPTAPADKSEIMVKIVAPASPTNTITIATGGSDVFNVSGGSTTLSLTRKFQSVWLQYQTTGAIWIVKTTDDALATWPGSTSVTTLGTITTGTWNGTVLDVAHGGTGQNTSSAANGALLQSNGTIWAVTPIGSTGQILTVSGGVATWAAPAGGGNPFADNAALVKNNADNTKTLTLSAVSITTGTNRTWTFPDVNGTVARNDAGQTFTGVQTFSSLPVFSVPLTTLGTIGTGIWQGTKIGLAYGGTNADLSATGGVSNYLKQISSGAAITVGTIPSSDVTSVTNRQTGNYVAILTDAGKTIEMNVAGANTFTIPPHSSVAFPLYTLIYVTQYSTGVCTITAGAGVTFDSQSGLHQTSGQNSVVTVYQTVQDEWYVWDGPPATVFSNGLTPGTLTVKLGGAYTQNTSFTGAFNISHSNAQFNWTSTYTATANNDFAWGQTGTFTLRSTASDVGNANAETYTVVSAAATQTMRGKLLNVTFTDANSATKQIMSWQNAGTEVLGMSDNGVLTHLTKAVSLGAATKVNQFQATVATTGAFDPVGYYFKLDDSGATGSSPGLFWSAMFNSGHSGSTTGVQGFGYDGASTNYIFLYNSSATNGFSGPDIKATSTIVTFESASTYNFSCAANSGTMIGIQGGSTSSSNYTGTSETGTWSLATAGSPIVIMHDFPGTLNYSASVTAPSFTYLKYHPTETSLTNASHYFITSNSLTNLNSFGGTNTPTSTLQTLSFAPGYVAKTGNYTLTLQDYTVEVTSGTNTQTLPTAVGISGRIYVITNSGSGTVTIGTTSSQTFVNVTATPTTLSIAQFGTATLQSNGTNWLRITNL